MSGQGVVACVPSDPMARLMYYLSCCNRCLGILEGTVVSYQKYYECSVEEKKSIIRLAAMLTPDFLLNCCFFLVKNTSSLLNDMANEFYDINTAKTLLEGIESNPCIVISEKSVRIRTIMVFTRQWIESNYIIPFNSEAPLIQGKPQTFTGQLATIRKNEIRRNSEEWERDSNVKYCSHPECVTKFSTRRRKHHCRHCGKIFCSTHCPVIPSEKYTRYCKNCTKLF